MGDAPAHHTPDNLKRHKSWDLCLASSGCLWHNTFMSRWILFLITIGIGAAAGLYYGWVINPVEYTDTSPDSLRSDYKVDYVLMIAEAYQVDADLTLAIRRLAVLGDGTPEESVNKAINFAASFNPPYPASDLALMQRLAIDLLAIRPPQETTAPWTGKSAGPGTC
jgi:hypothetical protein